MALKYPVFIVIGFILVIICLFYKIKKPSYSNGHKIANTNFVKQLSYYQNKIKLYNSLLFLVKVLCLISIIISSFLLARPYVTDVISDEEYNRDIFLCMDVSGSVNNLNLELVDELKETVSSLKGDRFGISIFNTSSVTLVPLTSDYEYVNNVLTQLKKSIEYYIDPDRSYTNSDDYFYNVGYLYSGTTTGSYERGSSLIGDGLASCVYNFPNKEEDRTRIIIFTTDNSLAGSPFLTLEEAANLSKEKNVIVYGIAPVTIGRTDKETFEKAVKLTKGNYYDIRSSTVTSIVRDIEKNSKSLHKKESVTLQRDVPTIPFIILAISIFSLIIIDRRVKL